MSSQSEGFRWTDISIQNVCTHVNRPYSGVWGSPAQIAVVGGRHILQVTGIVAMMLSISVSIAPLATLRQVFETQSAESIPAQLVLASLLCGSAWLVRSQRD